MQSQNIDELLKDIRGNKAMALFLGAGTDMTNAFPAGYPFSNENEKLSWPNLLKELSWAACINNTERTAIDSITGSPLKAAILKQRLGSSYIPIIQNWLYTRCNERILRESYWKYLAYLESPKVETLRQVPFGTLFVIADFILRQASVRAVFTQNYNNFLTSAIRILQDQRGDAYGERGRGMRPVDVYSGWKDEPYSDRCFFVYHVHGYIPPPNEMLPRKQDNSIVLSDEEFYQLSKDAYSWQNASQLHYLTHHTCIIIGLSLDDMTTARLLRYARLESNSERVYWLRGGKEDFGNSDSKVEIAQARLKNEYYASQHLCVVDDEAGYAHLYHEILSDMNKKKK